MTPARLHFHYSLYQWWGVPSRYVQLVGHLDPSRFACTTRGTPDVVDPAQLPDSLQQMGHLIAPDLRRQHMPWHNLNDLAAEAATHDLCRTDGVDIVHFLDGEHSGPWLPRALWNRGSGVRTVATFHQPPELAEKVVHGPALRHLDAVILMSPSQAGFFRRYLPEDRIHVILHGVDTAVFTPQDAKPSRGHRLHCITTGLHLRDWTAFQAVARALPDIRFTVVTSGRVTLDTLPNVIVRSGIPDADLAEAYRSADLLFLPLQDATANNSLLEGMASGLPVLSTDLPSVRAYVPKDASILVPGNRVPDLCAALTRLADDPGLRHRMGLAARQQAERLSWSHVIGAYEALYASLLAQPRPARLHRPARAVPDLASPATTMPPPEADVPAGDPAPGPAFATLGDWSDRLRGLGLTDEAGLIVDALAGTGLSSPETQSALALAQEAVWRWKDAADHWDRFIQICPGHRRGEGLARKAWAQAQAGEIQAAVQTIKAGAGSFDTLLCAGRLWSAFGSDAQAQQAWQTCTDRHPDRIEGFLGQARALLRQTDLDAAEALADHVRRVWPGSAKAAALWAETADARGDEAAARDHWTRVQAAFGPHPAILRPLARHLGQWADLAACDALIARLGPDDGIGSEIRLQFHDAAGDWVRAADTARDRLARLPQDPQAWLRYAVLLLRIGCEPTVTQALQILKALHGQAADCLALRQTLGCALIAAGQAAEARTTIDLLPQDLSDRLTETLRVWARLWGRQDPAGLRYWNAVVLGLGVGAPTAD